jgi:hypothetical protein
MDSIALIPLLRAPMVSRDSHTPGVGPPVIGVPTPPVLPSEIWHQIIDTLDDNCFTWFVLRRVSPFLKSVTEQVFSLRALRGFSVTFAGSTNNLLL